MAKLKYDTWKLTHCIYPKRKKYPVVRFPNSNKIGLSIEDVKTLDLSDDTLEAVIGN